MQKRLLKIAVCCISTLFILNVIASFYFYKIAIERNVKDFLVGNQDLQVSAKAMDVFLEGDWREWVRSQSFEEIEMLSYDNLRLLGYFLRAKEQTNQTVVLVHGYLGQASDMGLYGQYYYEDLGYNLFMMDLRGHGQSEGDYIGFGWHDRLDLIDWLHLINDKQGLASGDIILHGVSMGASAVLMASGEKLPHNVKVVVADSPYSNVYQLFEYQLRRMYHLPAFPVLPSTSVVTKLRAGYTFQEASTLKQVKASTVPILYIHGDDDTFVPTEMTEKLNAYTKSATDMLIVAGAKHGEAFVLEKEVYINKLNEFLKKYTYNSARFQQEDSS